MICELCGKTSNEGFRIRLEGSVVSACPACAALGEAISPIRQPRAKPKPKAEAPKPPIEHVTVESKASAEFDLVDDYGAKIKSAREKHGWTQEDLGKMVNEPHSLIHRIELGKFEPPAGLSRILQSKLGIRLLNPHEELEQTSTKAGSKDVTLGDLVVIRRRNK